MILILLNLLRLVLWPSLWYILENVPCTLEKNVYSDVFEWNVYVYTHWYIYIYTQYIYIDFLSEWFFHWWKWSAKVLYYYCATNNFCLMFDNICCIFFDAPMLGEYIFKIVISACWIDPFIIMKIPSLFLVTVFVLKSILFVISIATLGFFFFPFLWNTFFHPLTFSLCVCKSEVSLL